MNKENCSLSADVIAFIDQNDSKTLRIFDASSGKSLSDVKLLTPVKQIALSREDYPGIVDRQLALIDANQDLLFVLIKKFGSSVTPRRLTTSATSMIWHNDGPMLASIQDGILRLFYFPQVVYIDGALLEHTFEDREEL
jgi:WD40 repeat protein